MFVLTVKGFEDEGAYSIPIEGGGKVLLLFEEHDDADRYGQLLEVDDDYPEMGIIEVDDATAIEACKKYNYEYNIVRPDDIVIPPNDPVQEDKMA